MSSDDEMTPFERGVLSVFVMHEAWLYSMETIDQRFKDHKITAIKKRRLESKYTAFYENARKRYLKEEMNIVELENDAKTMILMLADLGVNGYELLKKCFRKENTIFPHL